LGEWSAANYGAIARNFWAGGFHFYQICGRLAAPFAIWWALAKRDRPLVDETADPQRRRLLRQLRVRKSAAQD